ncbi:alpha-glucan family phosphorylase [Candidatus Neomarinimicrobiota bacterium]
MEKTDYTQFKIAYFSAEIGLNDDIPTFSGGLGVLAGDHVKSAADLGLPFCAVTLLYKQGYFEQSLLDNGSQVEYYPAFDHRKELQLLDVKVYVELEGRPVAITAWQTKFVGVTGAQVPVLFLDTDLPENSESDRYITRRLYSGDKIHRIRQEAVLGIGGVRVLANLGASRIESYHMNEGHTAFLTLELMNAMQDKELVCKSCLITTHTPVPAGHDIFAEEDVRRIIGEQLARYAVFSEGKLNMTLQALAYSRAANGVSDLHGEISRGMFPEYLIGHITNGVHHLTWTNDETRNLYDASFPGWRENPAMLANAESLDTTQLVDTHARSKKRMLAYIADSQGIQLDPDKLTICFARRATGYKRANLLFSDLQRLTAICGDKVQFIFAGKAHPQDSIGKQIIRDIVAAAESLSPEIRIIYLAGYNMAMGNLLTCGSDVWLNNPIRPKEASGTSGMKAALNGVLNLSISDGWWAEGGKHGVNGWTIESDEINPVNDAGHLYTVLEEQVIPIYYGDKPKWASMMKAAISSAAQFTSHRMVSEYNEKFYK